MALDALKKKFSTGKKPTGSDFAEVIDTIDSKVGSTDLTSYATKQELTNLAPKTALTSLATKTDLTTLATKQEIANLAPKTALTPLAVKTEVPTKEEYNALLARVEALETPQA